MKYWLFRIGIAIIPHLPQRLLQRVALAVGWLLWAGLPGPRRRVRENLRHVPRLAADPPALRRATRNVFGNSLLNYVDFFRLPNLTAAELADYWEVSGLEQVDAALAQGRGCILISGHLGNFDYAMRHFVNLGYKLTVTQEHLQPERLHQLVMQVRNVPGVQWAPVDSPSGLRQLFAALRRNEIVIMPADRDIQGHGEVVPLFGAPARLPPGGVQLAQRTGAALLGVFPHRRGLAHGYGAVVPLPTLTPEEEAAETEPLRRDLRRVAKLLEQQIARDPEQWVVFQPIWLSASALPSGGQVEEGTRQLPQPEPAAPQHDEHLEAHHIS
jgi:lauroyl/myristoyl acyltransferase